MQIRPYGSDGTGRGGRFADRKAHVLQDTNRGSQHHGLVLGIETAGLNLALIHAVGRQCQGLGLLIDTAGHAPGQQQWQKKKGYPAHAEHLIPKKYSSKMIIAPRTGNRIGAYRDQKLLER